MDLGVCLKFEALISSYLSVSVLNTIGVTNGITHTPSLFPLFHRCKNESYTKSFSELLFDNSPQWLYQNSCGDYW